MNGAFDASHVYRQMVRGVGFGPQFTGTFKVRSASDALNAIRGSNPVGPDPVAMNFMASGGLGQTPPFWGSHTRVGSTRVVDGGEILKIGESARSGETSLQVEDELFRRSICHILPNVVAAFAEPHGCSSVRTVCSEFATSRGCPMWNRLRVCRLRKKRMGLLAWLGCDVGDAEVDEVSNCNWATQSTIQSFLSGILFPGRVFFLPSRPSRPSGSLVMPSC